MLPVTSSVDVISAATSSARVACRSLRGVIQVRVASQARRPDAPVTAVIAPAMHWTHMGRS